MSGERAIDREMRRRSEGDRRNSEKEKKGEREKLRHKKWRGE